MTSASTASHRTFVAIASAPLGGRDRQHLPLICPSDKAKYFLFWVLTPIPKIGIDLPVGTVLLIALDFLVFVIPQPACHEFDASVAASGPHEFAVRFSATSTASRPASVTIAKSLFDYCVGAAEQCRNDAAGHG